LRHLRPVLHDAHRPELEDQEYESCVTAPPLAKQRRTVRFETDGAHDCQHQRREQDQQHQRQTAIEQAAE